MLEWLAAVAIVRRTERRVELAVTSATTWAGWTVAAAASLAAWLSWSWSGPVAIMAAVIGALGGMFATARRRLVFDRDDGLLRVEQRILGVRSRLAIPLFHLRAVVICYEHGHYVSYVERRAGGRIRIDDARHLPSILAVARAICDVTQLRLVTDQGSSSSSAG
jgi:hypothetical protein